MKRIPVYLSEQELSLIADDLVRTINQLKEIDIDDTKRKDIVTRLVEELATFEE